MEKIEVKWSHTAKIWWSWFWRSTILIFVTVFCLTSILSITFGSEIALNLVNGKAGSILSFAIGIAASIRTLNTILTKEFNGYSIALIKTVKIKA